MTPFANRSAPKTTNKILIVTSPVKTIFSAILAGAFLTACKTATITPAPANKPASTPAKTAKRVAVPASSSAGKVLVLNKSSRFVVLAYPIASEPAIGQRLNVYRNGLKVGELKVTGPKSEGSIVADITAGEAQVADDVYEE